MTGFGFRVSGLALMGALCAGACFAQDKPPAISVGPNGTVLKDGKPYRGIGVNYFSAFGRTLADASDTSYRQGFEELAKHDIPFIRFMGGGFWPKDWKLYREDKAAYFRLMDGVVKSAEEFGIGLIPSLFWWDACTPDLVDEPRNQWGNPDSKTIAFMRQYVRDVVERYAHSPAIWAWELGNEYSLAVDLPNAADNRPWAKPDLGTRAQRDASDDLTHDLIVTACRQFAQAVRQYDKAHLITTGHSLPRASAHHQRIEKSWTQDTREQLQANLLDVTPDPANLISVHVYPFDKERRFDQDTTTFAEVLSLCMQASQKSGKPLFIGEFGASDTEKDGGPEAARKHNLEILDAIKSTGVPLAALWVFDLSDQDSFINVTPTNHRHYLLDELSRANKEMRNEPGKKP